MFEALILFAVLAFPTAQNSGPVETLGAAAWPDAPAPVIDALNATGCRIPQPVGAATKMNLIRGHFAHADQQDWAALCVDDDQHVHIEIVWSRDALCPSLPSMKADLLHTTVATASPHRIREYESLYAGFAKHAPLATHDGIEASPNGTASTVYFCVNGYWAERKGRPDSAH